MKHLIELLELCIHMMARLAKASLRWRTLLQRHPLLISILAVTFVSSLGFLAVIAAVMAPVLS